MASDIRAGRAFVELTIRNSKFLKGLRAARDKLREFGASATAIGRQMLVGGASMLAPFALGIKLLASFDDKMRAVGAVTRKATHELKMLSDEAKRLGATTSFTAVEVADLMTTLGRAGFNPDQVQGMTGAVLALARATGTDATEAAGFMSASIRQFGLDTSTTAAAVVSATRVADRFTATANGTFNTVEQLGEAMEFAGPIATDLGMTLEETLAILGTLGNFGIQGSAAGTAIRRIALVAASENDKLIELFGKSGQDVAGNLRPIVDIMDDIQKSMEGMGTAQRAAALNELFGLRGITGASIISGNTTGTRDLLKMINDSAGQAAETAAKMDAGIGGFFRIFLSSLEAVGIAIGESIEGPVTAATKLLTLLNNKMITWIQANENVLRIVALVGYSVVAAGGALLSIGIAATVASFALTTLIGMFTFFGSAVAVIGGAIGMILSPMGLMIAAVIAAGLAWVNFTDSGKRTVNAMTDLFVDLGSVAGETFGGIKDALLSGDLALAGQIAMQGLKVAMLTVMESISDTIGGKFGDVIGMVTSRLAEGDISGAFAAAVTPVLTIWAAFSEGLVEIFAIASNSIIGLWEVATKWISNKILEMSTDDGAIGKMFRKLLGIDLRESESDLQRFEDRARDQGVGFAERGGTTLDDAKAASDKQIGAQADSARAKVDKALRDAQARTRDAQDAEDDLNDMNKGGRKASRDALDAAQKELDRLKAKAAADKKTAEDKAKDDAAAAADGVPGGEGGPVKIGDSISGAFSAAAFAAMGQGGDSTKTAVDKVKDAVVEQGDKIVDAIKDGGAIVA